jgi:hypothetical protein
MPVIGQGFGQALLAHGGSRSVFVFIRVHPCSSAAKYIFFGASAVRRTAAVGQALRDVGKVKEANWPLIDADERGFKSLLPQPLARGFIEMQSTRV